MQLTRRLGSFFVALIILLAAIPAQAAYTPIPLQNSIDAAHRNFETRIGGSLENVEVFSITYIVVPVSFEEYVQQVIATWPLKLAYGRLYSNVDPMGADHLPAVFYNQVRAAAGGGDADGIIANQALNRIRVEYRALKSEIARIGSSPICTEWRNTAIELKDVLEYYEKKWKTWWVLKNIGVTLVDFPRPTFAVADEEFFATGYQFWWAPGFIKCHPWETPWAMGNAMEYDWMNVQTGGLGNPVPYPTQNMPAFNSSMFMKPVRVQGGAYQQRIEYMGMVKEIFRTPVGKQLKKRIKDDRITRILNVGSLVLGGTAYSEITDPATYTSWVNPNRDLLKKYWVEISPGHYQQRRGDVIRSIAHELGHSVAPGLSEWGVINVISNPISTYLGLPVEYTPPTP